MARKPEQIIKPINAAFDDVAKSAVTTFVPAKAGKADNMVSPITGAEKPDDIPMAIAIGAIELGDSVIDCAVLADETRVISDRGVSRAIGTKRGGSHWKRVKEDGALSLPPYISANNLRAHLPEDLIYILEHPIRYRSSKSGAVANGLLATVFPKVLKVWEAAYRAGDLAPQQRHIGQQAVLLLEGLDEVAMVALVDEATGYQESRRRDELQKIIGAYVLPEHRPYLRSVPVEFFKELHRVYGWEWSPDNRGPRYAGKLLRKLIYDQLPSNVLSELDRVNPSKGANYQRQRKHFQNLSEDVGIPHFQRQLSGVMVLMRLAPSGKPDVFKALFDRAYRKQESINFGDDVLSMISEDASKEAE
uniref:P63C domain-containing protein n=1 Tax=Candidatus Kentrum sp. DK TaxID=2126562 RepID=A0A450RVS7_9GAMM|nr:MAG: P63C domain-containing protein [Candidatus Kentron sp. DK]